MPSSIHSADHHAVITALAEARKRAGMTQIDLAKRIGRKQSYISNIERGERRVEVLDLHAIAVALEMEPVALFAEVVAGLGKMSEQ